MLLKSGDKVSFLNEKRDGIVKKILNNKMVLVEIEDGFDIPVLEHDLVKVEFFKDTISENITIPQLTKEKEERFPERKTLTVTDSKLKSGVYLAFIPDNGENALSGSLGIYLINRSNTDVLFTYSLKENEKFICTDFDQIDDESAFLLEVIDRTDIEKWNNIIFQFIFYKQGSQNIKPPTTCEVFIKPVKFYKEDNYLFCSLLDEKCFLISLQEKELLQPEEWTEDKWENKKIEKPSGLKIIGHINDLNKPVLFLEKHILEKGIAEVDLHIEELIENYSGKESFELLNIQLGYFSKMLESAIANKFKKAIFIHGVGNGKLKQEIINKLKSNYPDLQYQDASYAKYGKGATEVLLSNVTQN